MEQVWNILSSVLSQDLCPKGNFGMRLWLMILQSYLAGLVLICCRVLHALLGKPWIQSNVRIRLACLHAHDSCGNPLKPGYSCANANDMLTDDDGQTALGGKIKELFPSLTINTIGSRSTPCCHLKPLLFLYPRHLYVQDSLPLEALELPFLTRSGPGVRVIGSQSLGMDWVA